MIRNTTDPNGVFTQCDDILTNCLYDGAPTANSVGAELVISSMRARGYRSFSDFGMDNLGRINLLVGANNSGKTSLLEGLYMLASGLSVGGLWQTLVNRGETIPVTQTPGIPMIQSPEVSVGHLFSGHKIKVGSEFTISTVNGSPRSVKYTIIEVKSLNQNPNLPLYNGIDDTQAQSLALAISLNNIPNLVLPIGHSDAIRIDVLQNHWNFSQQQQQQQDKKIGQAQFLPTESLNSAQVAQSLNDIVLTPDEPLLIEALQLLDPRLERFAAVPIGFAQMPGQSYSVMTKGGVYIKLRDVESRVPIGSFGEGVWRIFAIAIALVKAKNSVLLVDEIDTGLHYSVMTKMWKLIAKSSEQLNVQVFATTHSHDCVKSLASICNPVQHKYGSAITIQRIERDKGAAVAFSEEEIISASVNDIEIR